MQTSSNTRWTAWLTSGMVILGLHLGVCALLYAATPLQGAAPRSPGFIEIYILGGGMPGILFLLPIELLSIATLAAIIEHYMSIQRDKLVPPQVVVELEQLLEEEQYEEAINICEATKNYITNIVGAAIARAEEGYDAMEGAAAMATEEENLKLNHKIQWLNLFGNVSPMMGLLGTVVGMVTAFSAIAASADTPPPNELAGGIFTALVTTVWGLLVAIPALTFYFIFRLKVQRLCFELSGVAMEFVERLKPVAEGE